MFLFAIYVSSVLILFHRDVNGANSFSLSLQEYLVAFVPLLGSFVFLLLLLFLCFFYSRELANIFLQSLKKLLFLE